MLDYDRYDAWASQAESAGQQALADGDDELVEDAINAAEANRDALDTISQQIEGLHGEHTCSQEPECYPEYIPEPEPELPDPEKDKYIEPFNGYEWVPQWVETPEEQPDPVTWDDGPLA